jgi:hypothetical protein
MVADSYHFDEEPDPDPHKKNGKPDPDRHQSEAASQRYLNRNSSKEQTFRAHL